MEPTEGTKPPAGCIMPYDGNAGRVYWLEQAIRAPLL